MTRNTTRRALPASCLAPVLAAVFALAALIPRGADAQGTAGAGAGPTDSRAEVERWFDSQPRAIVPVGNTRGAAVVIVKFNDYQCPACKQTYLGYHPIAEKYRAEAPGKVLFITKHYPLDPECNVNTPGANHLLACEAAAGVLLAGRQPAQGEALEQWVFANQATLNPQSLRDAIRTIGGVTDFEDSYQRTLEQVKVDIALGKLLGVNATPTFFINGVKVSGGLQPAFLDAIIAYELRKQQGGAQP
jgi:protein-disulfide isomerase